jgi:hypothetical protein
MATVKRRYTGWNGIFRQPLVPTGANLLGADCGVFAMPITYPWAATLAMSTQCK